MGKYDNIMRFAEIRKFLQEKQYKKALVTIEKIDTNKIKAVTELNLLADVYMKNDKYEEAQELLFRIYEKSATRRVLYQLICLSLKTGNTNEAEKLFEEYQELDKSSSDRIILKYCIAKAKGTDRAKLIQYLETLKKEDYQEEWAYELAKLYHKQGMEEECVRECGDIILWFGEGIIVEKAKLLKLHYVEGLDIVGSRKKAEPVLKEMKEPVMEQQLNGQEVVETEPVQVGAEPVNTEYNSLENKDLEVNLESTQSEEVTDIEREHLEETTQVDTLQQESVNSDNKTLKAEDEVTGKDSCVEAEEEDAPQIESPIEEEQEETLVDKMVREVFEQISTTQGPIHFVMIEERQVYLTQVVKGIARELCAREILPTTQIAKITAEKLNGINLKEKGERLKNGCLLIEQAGDLTAESINGLMNFMKDNEDVIVVVLEDNEDAIRWLFKKNKKLKNWFTFNIYLPME